MRAGTSDQWVFDQIFLYNQIETDFGQDVAFSIDAGANIGLTAVYLAIRFPSARGVGGRSTKFRAVGCEHSGLSPHHASIERSVASQGKPGHRQPGGPCVGIYGF